MKHLVLPTLALLLAACAGPPAKVPPAANTPIADGRVASEPISATDTTHLTSAELAKQGRVRPMTASASPDDSKQDRIISERVRRALMADDELKKVELDRIRIVTDGDKVTLNGIVASTADKVQIEQTARSVKGVQTVDNQIEELH